MKAYYHISSSALKKNDIFHVREDYIVAMNDVALLSLRFDVRILCFCLMSNHFHFVLKGSYEACFAFVSEFKRLCSIRMHAGNGEVRGLKDVELHFDLLDTAEYLENAIAYVLRNPLAAHIIAMPYFYEWSSMMAYFRGGKEVSGLRVDAFSERKRRKLLRTRNVTVPENYVLTPEGYVDPCCYIAADEVENIFKHPSRLLLLLAKRVENEFEISIGAANRIVMTDPELRTQLTELLKHEFGVSSLSQLTAEDRLRLCLLMKRNYNASVKQIARLLRLSQAVVASVL